jgi:hypothetical protein
MAERNKLVFLEEVLETALMSPEEVFLFGRENLLESRATGLSYDLVFHLLKGLKIDDLKQTEFLIIPLLSMKDPQKNTGSMYLLNERFPWINLFGIASNPIQVYNISNTQKGKEVSRVREYKVVAERALLERAKKDDAYGHLRDEIASSRSKIESLYL